LIKHIRKLRVQAKDRHMGSTGERVYGTLITDIQQGVLGVENRDGQGQGKQGVNGEDKGKFSQTIKTRAI
jgi:hypothetical protein